VFSNDFFAAIVMNRNNVHNMGGVTFTVDLVNPDTVRVSLSYI